MFLNITPTISFFPMSTLVLSPAELSLFHDQAVMPLKFSILAKMEALLDNLRNVIGENLVPLVTKFPPEFDMTEGKISKGENYHTFPYRVLDFPRAFHGEDVFTFRCVILWGHPIGFHIILKGRYKVLLQERIIGQAAGIPESMMLATGNDPWKWEFIAEEYLQARALQEPAIANVVRANSFLKISFFMPLEQYLDIPTTGGTLWQFWQSYLFGPMMGEE